MLLCHKITLANKAVSETKRAPNTQLNNVSSLFGHQSEDTGQANVLLFIQSFGRKVTQCGFGKVTVKLIRVK